MRGRWRGVGWRRGVIFVLWQNYRGKRSVVRGGERVWAGGVRGASQVATGNENNLRLRVYGEKAGLEWGQENPNYLRFTPYGKPPMTISRAGAGATASAKHASRIPSGHPEGYLEAFAQLYADLAQQTRARLTGREPAAASRLQPDLEG